MLHIRNLIGSFLHEVPNLSSSYAHLFTAPSAGQEEEEEEESRMSSSDSESDVKMEKMERDVKQSNTNMVTLSSVGGDSGGGASDAEKVGLLKRFYYNFVPEPGTEGHRTQMGTAGWLRAGVLGANDALVSVSSIMARTPFSFFLFFR